MLFRQNGTNLRVLDPQTEEWSAESSSGGCGCIDISCTDEQDLFVREMLQGPVEQVSSGTISSKRATSVPRKECSHRVRAIPCDLPKSEVFETKMQTLSIRRAGSTITLGSVRRFMVFNLVCDCELIDVSMHQHPVCSRVQVFSISKMGLTVEDDLSLQEI